MTICISYSCCRCVPQILQNMSSAFLNLELHLVQNGANFAGVRWKSSPISSSILITLIKLSSLFRWSLVSIWFSVLLLIAFLELGCCCSRSRSMTAWLVGVFDRTIIGKLERVPIFCAPLTFFIAEVSLLWTFLWCNFKLLGCVNDFVQYSHAKRIPSCCSCWCRRSPWLKA